MALRFYKNLKGTNLLSKGEFDVRFEIHDRDFSGTASEIPHMGSIPLSITWGNSGDRATEAIKKTSLKFSIVKEDGIDYSFFYTSDAKKYRVVVSSGQLNWQGYIAQDSYFEDLIYNGEIAITAIDNLSYLESSKFTLTGFQKVQDIIAHCVSDTGIDKAILYDDSFLTSNNTHFNLWQSDVSHLADSSKLEALESILLSLGLRIEQTNTNWRVSSMYERRSPTKVIQSSWLGKLDTKELVPAKKEIKVIQSLNTPSLYEMPTEDDYIPTTFQAGTPSAFICSKLANTSGTLAMKQWGRTGTSTITSYSYAGAIFREESSSMRIISANETTNLISAPVSFLPVINVAKPEESLYIGLKLNPEISAIEKSPTTSYTNPFTYLPTWIKFNFVIKLDGKYLDSTDKWVTTKSIRSIEIKNIATAGALDISIKLPSNTSTAPMQSLEIGIINCTDSESHKKIIDPIKFASIENISIYDKRNDDVPYLSNILTATGKDRNVNEEIDTDFCMCPIATQSAFMQYRNAFYFSDFNPVLTVNSEHLITAIGKQFLIEQYDPMSRYSGNVYFNGYGAATPFNLCFNFHGEICEPNGVTLNVCKMQLSGEFTELKTYQSGDNLGYSITTKSSKSEGGKGSSGSSTGGSGSGSSNVPEWAMQPEKPTYTASEVGALGKTEKAADSDKLDGIDSLGFFKSTANHANNLDNFQNNSAYWFSPSVANSPTSYGIVLNVNSDQTWRNQLAFGTDAQIYFRQKINDDGWRGWATLWHSGNSNKSDVDWTARGLYAGATGNCQASMSGTEGGSGTYASWTNYQWYNTNWKVGVRRGGSTDYNSFSISKDDTPFITINDNDFVSRNRIGIGCNPTITLAIGDSDTGFQWVQDGFLKGKANGVDAFGWTSSEFATYKPTNINDTLTIYGLPNTKNLTISTTNAGVDMVSSGVLSPHFQGNCTFYSGVAGSGIKRMSITDSGVVEVVGNLLVKGETTGYTLDSIVFDELTTTRSNTSYQSDQQQEALYLMSSEIQQLRTENADLKKRLEVIENVILNNKQ